MTERKIPGFTTRGFKIYQLIFNYPKAIRLKLVTFKEGSTDFR
jgi:hypothetical protein